MSVVAEYIINKRSTMAKRFFNHLIIEVGDMRAAENESLNKLLPMELLKLRSRQRFL